MNRIVVSNETDPCYNLALEEELLEQADSGSTLLYLWVNRPCVVLGRNQNPYLECDMDYIKSKGIDLVRRKSGGGAVYQDLGNLNYTFINREGEGSQAMQQQVLLGMMRPLGVDAVFPEGMISLWKAGRYRDRPDTVKGEMNISMAR